MLKKTPAKADWLPWEQVKALGADALTVAGAEAIVERPAVAGAPSARRQVIGGRVLTDQGWELANLADIDLDPAHRAGHRRAARRRTTSSGPPI